MINNIVRFILFVYLIAPENAFACCGISNPMGDIPLASMLIFSVILVVLTLLIYGKITHLNIKLVEASISTVVLMLCIYIPLSLLSRSSYFWLCITLSYFGVYVLFFKSFHKGTFLKAIGFSLIAIVAILVGVFTSLVLDEYF